jgi:hypothetical protein
LYQYNLLPSELAPVFLIGQLEDLYSCVPQVNNTANFFLLRNPNIHPDATSQNPFGGGQ